MRDLIEAIHKRETDTFRALLDVHSNSLEKPISGHPSGWFLSHLAVVSGEQEICDALFTRLQQLNKMSLLSREAKYGYQPVHLAVIQGNIRILKSMLKLSDVVNINALTEMYESLVFFAAKGSNKAILRFLLKKGADPGIQTRYGVSPIEITIRNNDLESFGILFQHPIVQANFNRDRTSIVGEALAADFEDMRNKLAGLSDQQSIDAPIITDRKFDDNAIRYLAFEGGGVKGVAFYGALKKLVDDGCLDLGKVKAVTGTSAGSIAGLLLATGHDVEALGRILKNINFRDLLEPELRDDFFAIKQQLFSGEAGIREFLGNNLYNFIVDLMQQDRNRGIYPSIINIIPRFFQGNPVSMLTGLVDLAKQFAQIRTIMEDVRSLWHRLEPFCSKLSAMNGLFPGDVLRETFVTWLRDKRLDANLTFRELHILTLQDSHRYKDLYVPALRLYSNTGRVDQQTIIFSHEETPDVPIVDAVRASISIPLVFYPQADYVLIDGNRVIKDSSMKYCDGGIHRNYFLSFFDKKKFAYHTPNVRQELWTNRNAIGFRLMDSALHQYYQVPGAPYPTTEEQGRGVLSFIWNLLSSAHVFPLQEEYFRRDSELIRRTVFIDTQEISGLDFDLNENNKDRLIEQGEAGANLFIERLQTRKHQPFRYI